MVRLLARSLLVLGAAVSAAGCTMYLGDEDYGYYDPYYDAYGASGYYGPGDVGYFGWYDEFYYPGVGVHIYDRSGYRHGWNGHHRRYWEGRRGGHDRRANWDGYRRGHDGYYRDERRADRRRERRSDRRDERREDRRENRRDRGDGSFGSTVFPIRPPTQPSAAPPTMTRPATTRPTTSRPATTRPTITRPPVVRDRTPAAVRRDTRRAAPTTTHSPPTPPVARPAPAPRPAPDTRSRNTRSPVTARPERHPE